MKKPSYILVNEERKIFTHLNEFDEKKKSFKGEYSILFNQYSEDDVFLALFLKECTDKTVEVISSENERYFTITNHYQRYLEDDIHKYIEEKIEKNLLKKKDLEMDRNIGQFQVALIQKMVEKQLEVTRSQDGNTPADHQVLLGKELSLQWVLHMIDDIVKKGNL